jgi:hypothetical protein
MQFDLTSNPLWRQPISLRAVRSGQKAPRLRVYAYSFPRRMNGVEFDRSRVTGFVNNTIKVPAIFLSLFQLCEWTLAADGLGST